MATVPYVVEGGRRLSVAIRPSGNRTPRSPSLPLSLLTEKPLPAA